eukprot:5226672-Amphidinium_carterae.1
MVGAQSIAWHHPLDQWAGVSSTERPGLRIEGNNRDKHATEHCIRAHCEAMFQEDLEIGTHDVGDDSIEVEDAILESAWLTCAVHTRLAQWVSFEGTESKVLYKVLAITNR